MEGHENFTTIEDYLQEINSEQFVAAVGKAVNYSLETGRETLFEVDYIRGQFLHDYNITVGTESGVGNNLVNEYGVCNLVDYLPHPNPEKRVGRENKSVISFHTHPLYGSLFPSPNDLACLHDAKLNHSHNPIAIIAQTNHSDKLPVILYQEKFGQNPESSFRKLSSGFGVLESLRSNTSFFMRWINNLAERCYEEVLDTYNIKWAEFVRQKGFRIMPGNV